MCSQNNAEDWMMQGPIAWPDTYLDDQTRVHVDRYLLQKQQISAPSSCATAEFKRRANDNAKLSELRGNREAAKEKKLKKLLQPKVALETRSDTELLDDGYKWRKYGQKSTKNGKYPRSYYRCTFGGCLVKKRVARSTADPAVVVTTYQGRHNHYRHDQYPARPSYQYPLIHSILTRAMESQSGPIA